MPGVLVAVVSGVVVEVSTADGAVTVTVVFGVVVAVEIACANGSETITVLVAET